MNNIQLKSKVKIYLILYKSKASHIFKKKKWKNKKRKKKKEKSKKHIIIYNIIHILFIKHIFLYFIVKQKYIINIEHIFYYIIYLRQ